MFAPLTAFIHHKTSQGLTRLSSYTSILMSVLTVARVNPPVLSLLFLRNLPLPKSGNTLSKLTPISSNSQLYRGNSIAEKLAAINDCQFLCYRITSISSLDFLMTLWYNALHANSVKHTLLLRE